MSRFWSEATRHLVPYVPGEQPRQTGLIKLNTNENPYGPSPRALAAIQAANGDNLRLYPDPASDALRDTIAALHGVTRQHVFVGNGSDEVLAHAFNALMRHDLPVLFPDVTYSFYPVYCDLYGIAHVQVPLDEQFGIRLADYRQPNGGIVFANPNAPTGMALEPEAIAQLLQANPDSVVLVDEAYADFGAQTSIELIERFPQLLVVRTLSKSHGLAGLRVGYAVGHPELIEGLTRVKDSFNSYPLGRLAQAGAQAALEDHDWFLETRNRIIHSREELTLRMREMGFEVLPSSTNFIFARHSAIAGDRLAALLRENNILVRHFRRPERIFAFNRITIGTEIQCDTLAGVLSRLPELRR